MPADGGKDPISVFLDTSQNQDVGNKDTDETSGMPTYVTELLPLLKAHHADDLPTKEALLTHDKAEQGLQWFAENATEMGVRARAIILLGLFDSEQSTKILDSIVSDSKKGYQLREAAFKGITNWSVEKRTERIDEIRSGLRDKNPLVVIVEVQAAKGIEPLQGVVQDVRQNHPSQTVREELSK